MPPRFGPELVIRDAGESSVSGVVQEEARLEKHPRKSEKPGYFHTASALAGTGHGHSLIAF